MKSTKVIVVDVVDVTAQINLLRTTNLEGEITFNMDGNKSTFTGAEWNAVLDYAQKGYEASKQ